MGTGSTLVTEQVGGGMLAMSRALSGLAWLGLAWLGEQPAIGHSLGALSCCPPPSMLDPFHTLLLLQLNGLHVGAHRGRVWPRVQERERERENKHRKKRWG